MGQSTARRLRPFPTMIRFGVSVPPVSFVGSNDDLALRKEFYSRRRPRNSGQKGEGSMTKLTPAEVLVLCWERGLLRSQHWPGFKLRREAENGSADGAAATTVDETIPEEQARAMLSR